MRASLLEIEGNVLLALPGRCSSSLYPVPDIPCAGPRVGHSQAALGLLPASTQRLGRRRTVRERKKCQDIRFAGALQPRTDRMHTKDRLNNNNNNNTLATLKTAYEHIPLIS